MPLNTGPSFDSWMELTVTESHPYYQVIIEAINKIPRQDLWKVPIDIVIITDLNGVKVKYHMYQITDKRYINSEMRLKILCRKVMWEPDEGIEYVVTTREATSYK